MVYNKKRKNSDPSRLPYLIGTMIVIGIMTFASMLFWYSFSHDSPIAHFALTEITVNSSSASCSDVSNSAVYCTIESAIDNAPDGSVITIAEGIYRENLYLTKDLILIGQGDVIINPNQWQTIRVFSSDVTLENLTLAGHETGLAISGTGSSVILNNIDIVTSDMLITRETIGIALRGGENNHITFIGQNSLTGQTHAMQFNGGSGHQVVGENLVIDSKDTAIAIYGGQGFDINLNDTLSADDIDNNNGSQHQIASHD